MNDDRSLVDQITEAFANAPFGFNAPSARDDYPLLDGPTARADQRRQMLDEIDRLRAQVETLRSQLPPDNVSGKVEARP